MKKRFTAITVAIILGIAAVFLLNHYLKVRERKYLVGMELRPVLIAIKEIPENTIIKPDMVKVVGFPRKYIQPGAVNSVERAIGLMAAVPIVKGEQVLETKLSPPEAAVSMSTRVPPGRRAVTIKVDSVSAAGGFIRPGDYVDITGTFTVKKKPVTATLFQNVLVLAVGGEMRMGVAPKKAASNVTLALTPEEVGFITVAAEEAKIRLILRAKSEEVVETVPVVDKDALLKRFLPTPEVPPTPEKKPAIEVFRGLKKEAIPLP